MNKELRKFGFSLGLGLNVLGCILFYRHRGHFVWFTGIGSIALVFGILFPTALWPLKKLLDRLIFLIGWLTCVISLSIIFYIIFTPIAFLMRLFGKDLLDQKINKKAPTYWIKRKQHDLSKEAYERMG